MQIGVQIRNKNLYVIYEKLEIKKKTEKKERKTEK